MDNSVADAITDKVQRAFTPAHVALVNESHKHAGPRTDSHFKLVLVSAAFEAMNNVRRHQAVYRLLAAELAGPIHALALHLYTPAEWESASVPESPKCKHSD
ncbi:MAG: BolA family transcriptional regulator [Pseudomonadales bacterium]|jgi:BolA protein|nr:BolA family transcriptional regulator [Pseudomonadales bacterium]